MLSPLVRPTFPNEEQPTERGRCCIVSIETERGAAGNTAGVSSVGGTKFKVLSFFVGTTTAGTGRLHMQSIIMDL